MLYRLPSHVVSLLMYYFYFVLSSLQFNELIANLFFVLVDHPEELMPVSSHVSVQNTPPGKLGFDEVWQIYRLN